MTDRELKAKVIEVLEELKSVDLIEMWNTRCQEWNYMEDYIECNNPDELMVGETPAEVLNHVDMYNYSLADTYAVDTIHGWCSFDFADEENSPIELSDLADYIITECDDMGNEDIEQLFVDYVNDNMEEDEEE